MYACSQTSSARTTGRVTKCPWCCSPTKLMWKAPLSGLKYSIDQPGPRIMPVCCTRSIAACTLPQCLASACARGPFTLVGVEVPSNWAKYSSCSFIPSNSNESLRRSSAIARAFFCGSDSRSSIAALTAVKFLMCPAQSPTCSSTDFAEMPSNCGISNFCSVYCIDNKSSRNRAVNQVNLGISPEGLHFYLTCGILTSVDQFNIPGREPCVGIWEWYGGVL